MESEFRRWKTTSGNAMGQERSGDGRRTLESWILYAFGVGVDEALSNTDYI